MKKDLKNICTGCMECAYICPKKAISFVHDEEGFLYPLIDKKKCVDCKKCNENCAAMNIKKKTPPEVYAARIKDEKQLDISSSGGVFPALSNYAFQNGGVVYGTSFNDDFDVVFNRATNKKELLGMYGSKYVQSHIAECYEAIKRDLDCGLLTVVVGTPCQINGVINYLGREYECLLLVDLVCHGVPSAKVWKDYKNFMLRKHKGDIQSINFRNKEKGWDKSFASINIDGTVYKAQCYMNLYGEASVIRPSCYSCKFADIRRVSDITIGDFWGIETIDSEWYTPKLGTSIVLVNDEKGKAVMESLKQWMEMKSFGRIEVGQMNLSHPTAKPKNRERFWNDYSDKGFGYIVSRYGGGGVYGHIRKALGYFKRKLFTIIRGHKY